MIKFTTTLAAFKSKTGRVAQPITDAADTTGLGFATCPLTSTSIEHSKLDYCNSLYFNLPKTQRNRLQHIQNSLARTFASMPKYSHITPVLKSLHWLKIEQHIPYKLISLTYKILTTSQPTYLHNLICLQTDNNTRSSDVVTLARPSPASSLKVTDRFFQYASPYLWNQLPFSLCEPCLLYTSDAADE